MVSRKRERSETRGKTVLNDLYASRERMNRAATEFLKIDMEMGLMFMDIARGTNDISRKQRNHRAAWKAYDTVLKLIRKVELSERDATHLIQGLDLLRSELEDMGTACEKSL